MPHKAPAIDFTAATRQITESANRAMANLTQVAEFDLKMLEQRRVEFMNETELSELNNFISGVNEEAALETVEQFNDWATSLYSDKDGRLTNRDLMEMRRRKQTVEQIIQKNNARQTQIMEAAQTLRGKDGQKYDGEYFHKNLNQYIKEGETPSIDEMGVSSESPWLKMRSIDPVLALSQERRPQRISRDTEMVETDRGWQRQVKQVFATDEQRDRHILERMRTDEQFQLGIVENYYEELTPEERQEITQKASELDVNPYDYYALTFKDYLWRDETGIQPDLPTFRQDLREPEPDALDLTSRPVESLSFHGKTVDGYDLLPSNLTTRRNLVNVRNLATGEIEDVGGVNIRVAAYDPDRDKIIVEARGVEHAPYELTPEGEPLYIARRTDAPGTPITGTEDEVKKRISEIEDASDAKYTEPQRQRAESRKDDIYYELDKKDYPNLLQGLKFPEKREQPRKSRLY